MSLDNRAEFFNQDAKCVGNYIPEYEIKRCVGIVFNQKEMINLMVKYLKELNMMKNITMMTIPDQYISFIAKSVNNMIASKGIFGYGITTVPFVRSEYLTNVVISQDFNSIIYFDALSNPCNDMETLKILNDNLIPTKSKKKWNETISYDEDGKITDRYLYILPMKEYDPTLSIEDRDKYIQKIGLLKDTRIDHTPNLDEFAKAYVGTYLPKSFPYKTRIVLMEYRKLIV